MKDKRTYRNTEIKKIENELLLIAKNNCCEFVNEMNNATERHFIFLKNNVPILADVTALSDRYNLRDNIDNNYSWNYIALYL